MSETAVTKACDDFCQRALKAAGDGTATETALRGVLELWDGVLAELFPSEPPRGALQAFMRSCDGPELGRALELLALAFRQAGRQEEFDAMLEEMGKPVDEETPWSAQIAEIELREVDRIQALQSALGIAADGGTVGRILDALPAATWRTVADKACVSFGKVRKLGSKLRKQGWVEHDAGGWKLTDAGRRALDGA